ncbi:MAG: hypothetical protein CL666_11275 [Balneola sp.]|nr:hypothetical protein [Balneola sp.]|tara:strand:+ start:109541 stop:110719 length:1179 start_codon:yes stop_codon:yes gene_type:complete
MNSFKFYSAVLLIALVPFLLLAQNSEKPFSVEPVFDLDQPKTAGLTFADNIQTFTIFAPDSSQNTYNHGVVLYPFKGKLFAMWQSSARDEDAADTQVYYSVSQDLRSWSDPITLTRKSESGITTSGGWWSHNDTLIAFINVWPENEDTPRQGYTAFMRSTDGQNWSALKRVKVNNGTPIKGIIEQDLRALPDGRIITSFHMQPGLIATPFYTDDPSATTGWIAGEMTNLLSDKFISRELEPSWFYREDGAVVMIFRDQHSSHKKLASISYDRGESWSTPELIDTPDSRSKQSAGNLPDGTAFMVNNPSADKTRYPLAITLSEHGYTFDRALLIRSGGEDLQPLRYSGKYKREGYSYPKSIVWGDYLYVGYATNKEDVEGSRIPLSALKYSTH